MFRFLGDLYYYYVWGIDRCGLGPDRWGEYCGGGSSGGIDYRDIW